MPKLKLVSSDGENFEVEENMVKWSLTLKCTIENGRFKKLSDEKHVSFPGIRGKVLKSVLTWIQHHEDENHTAEQLGRDELPVWDRDFLKLPIKDLRELSEAAYILKVNFLSGLLQDMVDIFEGKKESKKSTQSTKKNQGGGGGGFKRRVLKWTKVILSRTG